MNIGFLKGVALMLQLERKEQYTFDDLVLIMDILRGENGCPWDLEQTHTSLKSGTLEEVFDRITGQPRYF